MGHPTKGETMRIETLNTPGKGNGADVIPLELCGKELDSQTFGPVKCRKRPDHKGLHKWWNHAGRSTIWSRQPGDAT